MPLVIKGRVIDESLPIISVPITEKSAEEIILKAKEIADADIPMAEWRADFYEALWDEEKYFETLESLKIIFRDTVFLLTVRSRAEGGFCEADPERIKNLLLETARSRCPDLIDLEYFGFDNPAVIIKKIQEAGIGVVASYHNFKDTPSQAAIVRLMEKMHEADPDIVKIALMPRDYPDVCKLIGACGEFKENFSEALLIAISMGKYGFATRVFPKLLGSAITFASLGDVSAPGQIEYSDLAELTDRLSEYM